MYCVQGYQDFLPRSYGASMADEMFEALPDVLNEAKKWMCNNKNKRITNIQTVEYRILKGNHGGETNVR